MFRQIQKSILDNLYAKSPQITLIMGLRQTGKTTLAKSVCKNLKHVLFNFDLNSDQNEFLNQNRHDLSAFANNHQNEIILIDEVQKLPESTSIIKHLFDQYKMRFILTGSSELKIRKNFGDSLAGRTQVFHLFPLNLTELAIQRKLIINEKDLSSEIAKNMIPKYLIYGSLPLTENLAFSEIGNSLDAFSETLLSKDILEISEIKRSTKVMAVAKLLALQIGQLVNVNEISKLTELTRASVYNYLDILEQMNIIFRAYPLSTNERQAISEKFKIYFTDLGLRNALIENFNSWQSRLDQGQLLENAVFMGLKRQLDYSRISYKLGFFRSSSGVEIDIVLKKENQEFLYEVKTSDKFGRKKHHVEYITSQNAWKWLR